MLFGNYVMNFDLVVDMGDGWGVYLALELLGGLFPLLICSLGDRGHGF